VTFKKQIKKVSAFSLVPGDQVERMDFTLSILKKLYAVQNISFSI